MQGHPCTLVPSKLRTYVGTAGRGTPPPPQCSRGWAITRRGVNGSSDSSALPFTKHFHVRPVLGASRDPEGRLGAPAWCQVGFREDSHSPVSPAQGFPTAPRAHLSAELIPDRKKKTPLLAPPGDLAQGPLQEGMTWRDGRLPVRMWSAHETVLGWTRGCTR